MSADKEKTFEEEYDKFVKEAKDSSKLLCGVLMDILSGVVKLSKAQKKNIKRRFKQLIFTDTVAAYDVYYLQGFLDASKEEVKKAINGQDK